MDVASPILTLIAANSESYQNIVNRNFEKGHLCDIFDGKMYRKFVRTLKHDERKPYGTLVFNTNGAPLFKSFVNLLISV